MVVIQQVTDRENVRMDVMRKTTQAAQQIVNRVGNETTIVFCMTQKEAEDTCLALVRFDCHAGVYHGGLPRKRRDFMQKQWMMGQLTIICATSAFGGRSGSAGKPTECILLYSEADKRRADALTTERLDVDGIGFGGFEILEAEFTSEEETASMRGIGPVKAERYFNLYRFG
ncbi:hypothetical protein DVH05_016311 [Phytophthora capsici]|nr:hypothetical protein DVH05_016311 [Phytophthora capsici]